MADEKQIDDVFKRLAKAQQEQERAAHGAAKALDQITDYAAKDLTEKLKKLAKDHKILDDSQLSLIKSTGDLTDAIKHQEIQLEKSIDENKKSLKALNKSLEETGRFYKSVNNDKLIQETKDLIAITEKEIAEKQKSLDGFRAHAGAAVESSKNLNQFSKHLDSAVDSAKSWIKTNVSFSKSFELAVDAGKQFVSELNKATNVGLQSSFAAIGLEARHLLMSFDEFADVISKNRDVINQLGGGTKGIKEFSQLIQDSSKDLAFMGKDGIAATGRFVQTLKMMGISTKDSKKYNLAMQDTQKHFTEFSKSYGDNYEQFADLMESQMQGQTIQAKLNSLNQDEARTMREEIMARTDNLKALGLSNEQIKTFTQNLAELYDPHKNNQVERVQSGEASKAYYSQLAADSGSEAMKAALPDLMKLQAYKESGANDQQIQTMMISMPAAMKALGDAEKTMIDKQAALVDAHDKNSSTYLMTLNRLSEMGGNGLKLERDFAKQVSDKAFQNANLSPAQRAANNAGAANERNGLNEDGSIDPALIAAKVTRDAAQKVSAFSESAIGKADIAIGLGIGSLILNFTKLGRVLDAVSASSLFSKLLGGSAEVAAAAEGGTAIATGTAMATVAKWLPVVAKVGTGVGLMLHSENAGPEDEWAGHENQRPRAVPGGSSGSGFSQLNGLTGSQSSALLGNIAKTESGGKLSAENKFGYIGKYQFGAEALADNGLIDKDKLSAARKGVSNSQWYSGGMQSKFLNDNSNWSLPGGKSAFLSDESTQDSAMQSFTNKNIAAGFKSGALNSSSSPEQIAGYVKAAHLKGSGGANNYFLRGIDSTDANGTSVSAYAQQGANSIGASSTPLSVPTMSTEVASAPTPNSKPKTSTLDELKAQTALLNQIAMNTTQSWKPTSRNQKESTAEVQNKVG